MKKEKTGIKSIKKYGPGLCILLVAALIIGYFVNIMVIQNKRDIISLLVLSEKIDEKALENIIAGQIPAAKDEEIVIQTMDPSIEGNYGIILTWIRAGTVDVIVGEEESLKIYAQGGCMADWTELGLTPAQSVQDGNGFLCGVAQYDEEGNMTGTRKEQCFGWRCREELAKICDLKQPVVTVVVNAPHMETALKTAALFAMD